MHHNNTLAELKAAIIAYANLRFCPNGVCTNIANSVFRIVTPRQIRHQMEINDLYYGSVGSCIKHDTINYAPRALSWSNTTLLNLYIDWRLHAREFMRYQSNTWRHSVEESYKTYVHRVDPIFTPHGLEDTGSINTDFYYNIHNPYIPEVFQGNMTQIEEFSQPNKTSRVPLACIVVNMNYSQTFSGGKTKKRRQNRRNSRKHLRR